MENQRNSLMDLLKAICIIFIVITHFSWSSFERQKFLFPFWIDMAVPVFMLISGYVSTERFYNKNINSLKLAYKSKDIYKKIIRYSIPFLIIFIIEESIRILRGN